MAIKGLSGAELERMLYTIWVRKEALFKGIGQGLSGDLNSVCVIPSDHSKMIVKTTGHSWHIVDITTPEGYCGAVSYMMI